MQRKTLGVALDGLLHATPQAQQVVDLLVGAHQAVVDHVLEHLHGRQDIALAERILIALEADAVDLAELLGKDTIEKHCAHASAAQCQRLLRRQVGVTEVLQEL